MLTEQDIYLFREGTHAALYRRWAATCCRDAGRRRTSPCGRRTRARSRSIGDWNGWKRGRRVAQAALGPLRHLGGARRRGRSAARPTSTAITTPHGARRGASADPVRFRCRGAAARPPRAHGRSTTSGATPSGCARARRATRSTRRISVYEVHLGSWRREPRRPAAHLSRDRGAARGVRARAGLHPRGADADHRASVLRLVGLPDHRLLRAHARATARRRTSCTWSTCCTSTASA